MSIKARLQHLERHNDSRGFDDRLPIVFFSKPTESNPHAADGLVREQGETFDHWIERYQRTTGKRVIAFRRDDEMETFSEAEGWRHGMDLFI